MDADEVALRYGLGAIDPTSRAELPSMARRGLERLAAVVAAAEAAKRPGRLAALATLLASPEDLADCAAALRLARDHAESHLVRLAGLSGLASDVARLRTRLIKLAPPEGGQEAPVRLVRAGSIPLGAVLARELPDGIVVPEGWQCDSSGIWHLTVKDGATQAERVSHRPLIATGVLRDALTGEEAWRLEWRERGTDRWPHLVLPAATIQDPPRLVAAGAAVGAPVGAHTRAMVARFLAAQVECSQLPTATASGQCGWLPDRSAFLAGHTLVRRGGGSATSGVEPAQWGPGFAALVPGGGDQQIAGTIGPAGDGDAWADAIARYVLPHAPASMALYASLAAPLLGILADVANPVLDWSGQTSTGKTTALWVAASVWGRPSEQGGYIQSWDITPARFERLAAFLQHLPICLDDTSRQKDKATLEELVYAHSQGIGRGRAKPDGSRDTARWAGVLLSSGEGPLLAQGRHGGSRARAICITDAPFGAADGLAIAALREALSEHYGHAGVQIVRRLAQLRDRWPEWRARWRAMRVRWRALIPSEVGDRLSGTAALLEMGAVLAHEVLSLPRPAEPHIERLAAWLSDSAGEADRPRLALGALYGWCVQHPADFWGRHTIDPAGPRQPGRGWAGAWSPWPEWAEIAWVPDCLDRVLTHLGHTPAEVLRAWDDRGWIVRPTDEKRRTQRCMVGAERVRCVVISRAAIESVI